MRTLRIVDTATEIAHADIFNDWDEVIKQIIKKAKCDYGVDICLFDNTNIKQSCNLFNQNSDLKINYDLIIKRRGDFKVFAVLHGTESSVGYYTDHVNLISQLNSILQSCCYVETSNLNDMSDEEQVAFAAEVPIVLQPDSDIYEQFRKHIQNKN